MGGDQGGRPDSPFFAAGGRRAGRAGVMEATAGIEPAYTALQAAASPLRHVASEEKPLQGGVGGFDEPPS